MSDPKHPGIKTWFRLKKVQIKKQTIKTIKKSIVVREELEKEQNSREQIDIGFDPKVHANNSVDGHVGEHLNAMFLVDQILAQNLS